MKTLILNRPNDSRQPLSEHPKPIPQFQDTWNHDAFIAPPQIPKRNPRTAGKIGWALLWLLGIPLPVLVIAYFLKGCMGG